MPVDNSKYTLLLAKDSFRDPEKIAGILKDAGFHIREGVDLQEMVRMSEEECPDLIMVDIDKSVRQDVPFIQELRHNKITSSVPVLLIASGTNEEYLPECLTYDNVDFITKPFRPHELVIRLQRQLSLLRAERTIKRQNEKLKRTLEARDKLYSVIAHDLRAPIGTIKMINSSIENQKEKIGDPKILKLFEMINETTEEAFNLLENLLRWTRTQNGKTRVYAAEFNINVVIRQVLSLFSTIAGAKDISLQNKVEKPLSVYADEDMVKTILRNLISNAVKFTYPGGNIEVHATKEGEYVKISVTDNGKGISKEMQRKLLKTNAYITTYGTHNEKGCGLGLVLCRDFVKLNKGEFGFSSQEGVGTTFYFTLPVSAPPL